MLGTFELAAATGMRQTSIARLARQGKLPYSLYPGEWPDSSRPRLFEPSAVGEVKRLQTVGRTESYRQRSLEFHARRRAAGTPGTKPKRGALRPCRGGCRASVYLHPYRLKIASAGYCPRCQRERAWPRGLGRALYNRTGNTKYFGRFATMIARAAGTKPGPKSKAEQQSAAIYEDYNRGVPLRTIAKRRGLDKSAVYRQVKSRREAEKLSRNPLLTGS
jgi:hypothetical protein